MVYWSVRHFIVVTIHFYNHLVQSLKEACFAIYTLFLSLFFYLGKNVNSEPTDKIMCDASMMGLIEDHLFQVDWHHRNSYSNCLDHCHSATTLHNRLGHNKSFTLRLHLFRCKTFYNKKSVCQKSFTCKIIFKCLFLGVWLGHQTVIPRDSEFAMSLCFGGRE